MTETMRLLGSDGITTDMADQYGQFEDYNHECAVKIAQGNPGAMRYLIDMHKYFREQEIDVSYDVLYGKLKRDSCLGSNFYVLFKERGEISNTADVLYENGDLG